MRNRTLLPVFLVIGTLGLTWMAARFYLSAPRDDAPQPQMSSAPVMSPGNFPPGSVPPAGFSPGFSPAMPPSIRPTTVVGDEAISPDGKFIALNVITSGNEGARRRLVIVEAASGRILLRDNGQINSGKPIWSAPGQPQRLDVGYESYAMEKQGSRWNLQRVPKTLEMALADAPPAAMRERDPGLQQEEVLRASDLAVWWVQNPNSGEGTLKASALRDGSEIWLPASFSQDRITGNTEFAAPPFRAGAPHLLAALYDPENQPLTSRLEVWNLSRRTLITRRAFSEWVRRLAWTRDGNSIVLHDTPRADAPLTISPRSQKDLPPPGFSSPAGIDILDAKTGKTRVALTLYGLEPAFDVSDDGRYFLTVENQSLGRKWLARLAIRRVSDGKVVSRFERDRKIEAQPHFAPRNSSLLMWSSQDTVFLQNWRTSEKPQKLAPRRLKIPLS